MRAAVSTVPQAPVQLCALDALETEPAEAPPLSRIDELLDLVSQAPAERFPAPGSGHTLRISTSGLLGAALEVWGSCIHLAAFPRTTEASDRGFAGRAGMTRASTRRVRIFG